MPTRVVKFTVAEEGKALGVASDLLHTPPENIQLKALSGGDFRAQMINADAELEIEISPNKMSVRVTGYAPLVGDGKPLDAQMIHQQLAAAGVVFGLDDEEIGRIIERTATADDVHGSRMATGCQPQPPQDARIEPVGDLNRPVLPGMKICHKIPLKEAQSGRTVTGEELPYASKVKVKDLTLSPRSGAKIAEQGMVAVAATYGLATISGGEVEVKPLYTVSSDQLTVTATIYALDSNDEAITAERMRETLTSSGLVYGFAEQALAEAFAKAQEDTTDKQAGLVADVVIMQGDPPKDGEDARLELFFEADSKPGEIDEKGRIDYKERGVFRNVQEGQKLGAILPPTPGQPGTNVRSEPIPARDGEVVNIQAGENVDISQDGRTITSDIDGVIVYAHNILSVTDVLEISGDVDYETGNVHLDKGSVKIKGTIRTGFAVEVVGSVWVGEAIEGATVTAGGDIEVRHGLVMHDQGKLVAGGSVHALFAENAIIEADGDVVIANDTSNCDILARGKVIAVKNKGKIMGGKIRAVGGVEANEIGSKMAVPTRIILGLKPQGQQELVKERASLKETLSKIRRIIGDGDVEHMAKQKRQSVATIIETRMAMEKRLEKIEGILDETARRQRTEAKATVQVRKLLHPGAKITIAGQGFEPEQPIERCCLYYDHEEGTIRVRSL